MFLTSWRCSRVPSRSARPTNPLTRFRPWVEGLESRDVPTVYNAATVADLITDINAANKSGGVNTINLAAGVTFDLTAVNNTADGANGLPVITGGRKTDNLTVVGNGAVIQRDAAAPAFRLFDVAAGASLTLQNVTLVHGLAQGAGVAADGGAVYNQGTLTLSQISALGNAAMGGLDKKGAPGNAAGGAIWSRGFLTIDQSVIDQNSVIGVGPNGSGYGGGVYIAGGTAAISNSRIGSDSLTGSGGNTALGDYDPRTGVYSYSFFVGGYGAGVYVAAGTTTLTNDVIDHNSAGHFDYGGTVVSGLGGGIDIASGASVFLDSSTRSNTFFNYDYTSGWDGPTANIYGSYTLLP